MKSSVIWALNTHAAYRYMSCDRPTFGTRVSSIVNTRSQNQHPLRSSKTASLKLFIIPLCFLKYRIGASSERRTRELGFTIESSTKNAYSSEPIPRHMVVKGRPYLQYGL